MPNAQVRVVNAGMIEKNHNLHDGKQEPLQQLTNLESERERERLDKVVTHNFN